MNPLTKRPRKPEVLHAYRVEDAIPAKPENKRGLDDVMMDVLLGMLMYGLPALSALAVLAAISAIIYETGLLGVVGLTGFSLFLGICYLLGRRQRKKIDAEVEAIMRDPNRKKEWFP